jgi:hypothetical protein
MMAITNQRRKERRLVSDTEVRARASRVKRLLRIVCGKDEFPYFVSDAATVYDVCSLLDSEIVARLVGSYGITLEPADLRLPIWQLVDRLEVG